MGYTVGMDAPRKIDLYTDAELMTAFWSYFGASRGVAILGWCVVGSMSGTDDPAELRRRLEARGLHRSSLYRALDDLRTLREHLEGQPLPRRDSSYAIALARRLTTACVL